MLKNTPNPFGCAVKTALIEKGLTQEWLVRELRRNTGLYVDAAYVSRILTGERKPPKIIAAIKKILCIDNCTLDDVQKNGQ